MGGAQGGNSHLAMQEELAGILKRYEVGEIVVGVAGHGLLPSA
jgi:hypothetical protein